MHAHDHPFGSARFASDFEVRRAFSDQGGLPFGFLGKRKLTHSQNAGMLLIGGAGSGKFTSVLAHMITTRGRGNEPLRCAIFDPKREMRQVLEPWFAHIGAAVYEINAYYRCETRGCEAKSKSIARAKLEAGFEEIMQRMAPSHRLVKMARDMFAEAWALRGQTLEEEQDAWKAQLKTTDKQIEETLDKIMEAENKSVIRAFEKRIDTLEKQKISIVEKMSAKEPEKLGQRECMELSLNFLSNPWIIYKNGGHAAKQTVLKLAFSEPLSYGPNGVYGTPKFSIPFKVLEDFASQNAEMVHSQSFELRAQQSATTAPAPRDVRPMALSQHTR